MTADGEGIIYKSHINPFLLHRISGTWARSEDVNAEEQELEMRVIMPDNTTYFVRSTNLTLYSGQTEEYYVLE